ncbi:MAG: haloacid dehalogenase-like hydrolase [Bacilli bacterium]|nr:haloacid dehalogenase-like hydrolase [Bacilli bacterium]
MVIKQENLSKKLEGINKDNVFVVADFDKTITTKNSNTTFSLFSKSGFYPEEYAYDREKLYQYYRPIELDPKISDEEKYKFMKEWQEKAYRLLLKYQVRESDIAKIIEFPALIELRDYAVDFMKYLKMQGIPLIINSAGIGNFIIALLERYECMGDNVFIYSNMLEFVNDEIVDSIDDIIHSMNKYNIQVPNYFKKVLSSRKKAILIGDQLSDLKMMGNLDADDVISFGFLESKVEENEEEFLKRFDVVLKGDETFDSINKILSLR